MIENYIAKEIDCACGRKHTSRVETIVIKRGVIDNEFVKYIKDGAFKKLIVVCDKKSYAAAGERVCAALENAGVAYRLHRFSEQPLTPNEHAIGNLAMDITPDIDLIVAVGSGTVGDVCRYVSAIAKLEYCTVGTAPSMDGYISGGSALIYNGMKINFETHTPKAVFFDPDILASAPRDMVASGVGDLLGKISCLTDWKLSKIVTGEWHCEFISGIVDAAIEKTVGARDGIAAADSEATATLLEALLLSGVGMDFAENSRPASGCEHHMSHFLEMRYLIEGREAVFHGTKVGIGTVISLKAYEYLAKLTPDFAKIRNMKRENFGEWEENIRAAFKRAADEIIDLEKKAGKNAPENVNRRLDVIEKNWNEIVSLAGSVPPHTLVKGILTQLDAPTLPAEIGVEREMARQAIMYAKELRDRYTVLQLLYDIGELENFANTVIEEYYG